MKHTKYPRTPHLPWSEGATSDDVFLNNCSHFEGKEVVVTEKLDGECTSMYHDKIHARSIDSRNHPSSHYSQNLSLYSFPNNNNPYTLTNPSELTSSKQSQTALAEYKYISNTPQEH